MPTYQNPNFQPFNPAPEMNQAPPPRRVSDSAMSAIPQAQSGGAAQQSYHAGQGSAAAMQIKAKCEGLWLGWVAYTTGTRYYEMHPDVTEAAIYGAHALRRWWVWLFFFKVWLGTILFLGWATYLHEHKIDGESFNASNGLNDMIRKVMIWIIPATVAILIMYTRNIDFALFKRRAFYWLLRPVAILVEWVPNWVLYLLVLFPLFGPWPLVG